MASQVLKDSYKHIIPCCCAASRHELSLLSKSLNALADEKGIRPYDYSNYSEKEADIFFNQAVDNAGIAHPGGFAIAT